MSASRCAPMFPPTPAAAPRSSARASRSWRPTTTTPTSARPGPRAPTTRQAFAARLAGALTLIAVVDGAAAGFASLKGGDVIDMLYVDARIRRPGRGTALDRRADQARRARAARSASRAEASEVAKPLFERLGFTAQKRNLVRVDDEWLANTTMTKSLGAEPAPPDPALNENPMSRERLYLFDTTLRDGALTTGVDFSLDDKRNIAGMLDRLGVDYVEGGYPGANPLDTEFFQKKPTKRARFCAFGMTKRPGRSVGNDPGVAGLLASDSDAIVYVAKSWDYHVHVALGCTLEENLDSIAESVRAAVELRPRGDGRLRAFLRRLQGQSEIRARLREDRDRGRRALGGALRHQRRHAAARDRADRRRGRARDPRRPARHPRP